MARKGIAVPYIIALILGIIVVGVIGYWFFTTTSTGGGSARAAQCDAKKTQWCIEWSKSGFAGISPTSLGSWDQFAVGCTGIGITEPRDANVCRSLTGLGGGAASTAGNACDPGTTAAQKADADRGCAPLRCDTTTKTCK